jgi:hypothetical protein
MLAAMSTTPDLTALTAAGLNRRRFIRITTAGLAGGWLAGHNHTLGQDRFPGWDPTKPLLNLARKLIVQPAFMYRLPVRKEESSWTSWGGV